MTKTFRIYTDNANGLGVGQPTYHSLPFKTAKAYAKELRARGFTNTIIVQETF